MVKHLVGALGGEPVESGLSVHDLENLVDGLEDSLVGDPGVFGFTDIGTLPGQPENDCLAPKVFGDIHAAQGAIQGIFAVTGVVGGVSPIDRRGGKPQPGSDKLGNKSLTIQNLFHCGRLRLDLGGAEIIQTGDNVIVVELHPVEAQGLIERKFLFVRKGGSNLKAERVRPFVDIPGTKRESMSNGSE